jgi:two-component system KDP operon response regulator KdpE
MKTEPLILAVDDEQGILLLLKLELTAQGYHVLTASNGEEALDIVESQRPDLVLLDIMMPDMTGIEVMRSIREHSSVPIILLTAKDSSADKVQGLGLGADDYVVKPFSPDEVSARIAAVLRRSVTTQAAGPIVAMGDLEIDLNRRLVRRAGEVIDLTRTEWLLLQHLALNAGRVMLNTELLSKVWGPAYRDDLQYLRVWVSRLRKKIEEDPSNPEIITTKPGIGYMFAAETVREPELATS